VFHGIIKKISNKEIKMKELKNIITLTMVLFAMSIMTGCGQKQVKQEWEYKIAAFTRDQYFSESSMQDKFTELGRGGWEYAGTVCNNGMNASVVVFKRPK
jgi:hypothetical protein